MCPLKIFWSNVAIHLQSESIKPIKIPVFPWYVWYSTTNTEVRKRFYFILNIKYRSFLKFWAPFQLRTTKTRFCGSSQTFRRNEIFQIHPNSMKSFQNLISSKSLRGTTEASFCRTELQRGSKFQERSILYVLNKIKAFTNFCFGRRISNVSWKNWIFDRFDGFRLPIHGKVRPKNF